MADRYPFKSARPTHGEVLSTRDIVDRLLINAVGLSEQRDYIRALEDIRYYDDLHYPNRAHSREESQDNE